MDRQQVYPGAIPLETDLLNTNKNVMTAIAKLAAAMFGTSTVVNGLAVTQTTVASMQVSVAAGEIYQLANMDSTAYSSLAADTTHQIMKQGISLDPQLLTLVAPGTVGFSINYLIEATFTESDTTAVVLPYYNASNPSTAYSGPANAGTTNNTKRQGLVTLVAKAGTAATTGTQTTPAPDSGYVGIAVVTVAYGAVSVVNANISGYSAAPFINRVGNYSAQGIAYTSGATLTAAQLGQAISCQSGGYTLTLPAASTCPSGSRISFQGFTTSNVTIARQGTDLMILGTTAAATSCILSRGGSLDFVSNGSNIWTLMGGADSLPFAIDIFANSLGSNGYQKLPSGLIMQWGIISCNAINGPTSGVYYSAQAISFPIAFTTAVYSLTTTQQDSADINDYCTFNSLTNSGVTLYAHGSTSGSKNVFFLAIGK